MKAAPDCIPCYLKQVLSTLRAAGANESEQHRILCSLFPLISRLDPEKSPAENSSLVLFEAYRLLGESDPFSEAKAASNRLARSFLPALERVIGFSEDPLLTACRVAVAGNVIDMGIMPGFDVGASIEEELARGFSRCDYGLLRASLREGGTLVVIGDNSGEIYFDYLLLARLREFTKDLYYVVKGGPILNDATLADAEEAGIPLLARVVPTGNNYLGIIPELCSDDFVSLVRRAHLVLSKGQANYETLEGTSFAGTKTFFLLRAKCPVVAGCLGVKLGESVLVQNRVREGG